MWETKDSCIPQKEFVHEGSDDDYDEWKDNQL